MEQNEKNKTMSSDDFFVMLIFLSEVFRNIRQTELDKEEKEEYNNAV